MEAKTKNGLIVTGIVALVVVVVYFGYKKFFPEAGNLGFGENVLADNFEMLQTNLPNNKPAKDGTIVVPFSIVNNVPQNKAQFYKNGRVIIYDSKNAVIKKGSYSDGGKTIAIDGGKTASTGSVFNNLLAIK